MLPSDPLLRRARADDLDALARLEECFPTDRLSHRHFHHLLKRGHADIWVCVYGEALVGNVVVLYRRGAQKARMYSLVVHSDYQRRGIARILVDAAETAAAGHGCCEMRLEVRSDNASAIKLYQKRGYVIVEELEAFYEDGSNALRMSKRLTKNEPKTQPRFPRAAVRGAPCSIT